MAKPDWTQHPPIQIWVADRQMTITKIGAGLMAISPDGETKTAPFDMDVGGRVDFYAVVGQEIPHVSSNFIVAWDEQ